MNYKKDGNGKRACRFQLPISFSRANGRILNAEGRQYKTISVGERPPAGYGEASHGKPVQCCFAPVALVDREEFIGGGAARCHRSAPGSASAT